MSNRRQQLTESARLLRVRLTELENHKPAENQRPMHEVAVRAVKDELTNVGRKLRRENI